MWSSTQILWQTSSKNTPVLPLWRPILPLLILISHLTQEYPSSRTIPVHIKDAVTTYIQSEIPTHFHQALWATLPSSSTHNSRMCVCFMPDHELRNSPEWHFVWLTMSLRDTYNDMLDTWNSGGEEIKLSWWIYLKKGGKVRVSLKTRYHFIKMLLRMQTFLSKDWK